MTLDELLAEHQDHIADTARQLLSVLRSLLPEAEERVYPGWHGVGIHTPATGYLGGVFPRAEDVQLGFEAGYRMDDPNGLLEFRGNRMGWLAYRQPEDIDVEVIEGFLGQAGAL